MILPWKRKEVFMGTSMQDFCKVRELLSESRIQYDFRIVNRNAWGQSFGRAPALTRFDAPFGNQEPDVTYYVYVDKQDYETAGYLLKNNGNS